VDDQICTPSYTVDVAETTLALLKAGQPGLYHVTNSGSCSWHELARTIFELAGAYANLTPIRSREYPTPARRPSFSVLDHAGLRALGIPSPRPWREALAAYLRERQQKLEKKQNPS
jgi:dTDP-4-dehydrorhamnose reductase